MNNHFSVVGRFLLICLLWHFQTMASAASPESKVAEPQPAVLEATLRFFNRDIVTFRGSLFGVSAPDRAKRAQLRLQEQLSMPGPYKVTQKVEAAGIMLQINGATTLFITPEDAKRLQDETLEGLSQRTVVALELAIAESQESRNLESILKALVKAGLATLVALLLGWGLSRVRSAAGKRLMVLIERRSENLHIAGVKLFQPKRMALIVQKTLKVLLQVLLFVLFYEWLSFVLASFPFTRVWGEMLSEFLWGLTLQLGSAVASAIPGIFTAAVIFYIASAIGRLMDSLFERIRCGDIQVNWLDAEVAEPTRRIVKAALWLFGLAMAYPYLPGAQTEAFKGLSVLLGLMITLGSSNLVGQAASGLILTYGRVFRKGEYVRIGEHEGTVTDLGMFSTRIRTGMGEEVNLANSMVLTASTKNYSRTVKGQGFILDTTVTIGYDTPWRQVDAMLEEAARRTEGVLADPHPKVFQTALNDWYPQYRLVCQAVPSEPRPRALILSALHANIQDVFNEYGVQIMSPQYFADPAEPKIVPQDKWYASPARKPD
jgi:small-conductance mechanosensitive channel